MSKTKKILAAMLAATMVLGVTACGTPATTETPAEDTATESTATEDSAEATEEGTAMEGPITVYSREDGSGTRGAFVELMGVVNEEGEDMTTQMAVFQNGTNGVMTGVASDPNAIGYISLGSIDDTIKPLSVDGVEPTAENILSGDYTVARPFNIAMPMDAENALVDDFISFIMSVEGQAIVEEDGFIPMEATESYTGGDQSGTIAISGSTSVYPVMEKLKEAYIEINSGVTIDIQSSGSSSGMKDAMAGTVDIGMASRELKDEEKAALEHLVIAQDGIAMIVNNENPMSDITSADITAIYTGEKTEW